MKKFLSMLKSGIRFDYVIVGCVYLFFYLYAVLYIAEVIFPPFATDPFTNEMLAEIISQKGVLLRGMPAYFFTPIDAYVHYLVKLLSGENLVLFFRLLIFIQMTVFLTAAVYFKKLIQLLFPEEWIHRIAYYLFAFYPVYMFYAIIPVKDIMSVSGVIFSIYHLIRYLKNPSLFHLFSSGVLFSLAASYRLSLAFVAPVFVAAVFLTTKKRVRDTLIYCISCTVCILPFTLRNVIIAREPVLLSSVAGYHCFLGNYENAKGVYVRFRGIRPSTFGHYYDVKKYVEQAEGRALSDTQVNKYWKQQVHEFIMREPGKWAGIMLVKLLFLFNNQEISNNYNIEYFRMEYLPFKLVCFPFGFGVLFIGGIFGFIYAPFPYKKYIISGFILISCASLIIFISSRYRLVLTPFLFIGFIAGIRSVIMRNFMFSKKVVLIIIALAMLTYYPLFTQDPSFLRSSQNKHEQAERVAERWKKKSRAHFMDMYRRQQMDYIAEYTDERLLEVK